MNLNRMSTIRRSRNFAKCIRVHEGNRLNLVLLRVTEIPSVGWRRLGGFQIPNCN